MRWILLAAAIGVAALVIMWGTRNPGLEVAEAAKTANHQRDQLPKPPPQSTGSQYEPPNPGEALRRGRMSDWNNARPSLRLQAAKEMVFLADKPGLTPADLMACVDTSGESSEVSDTKVSAIATLCIATLE